MRLLRSVFRFHLLASLSTVAAIVTGLLTGSAMLSPADAAELRQYRVRDVQINTCQIDLQKDNLRTYWKDDQGKVFGKFSQLRSWLRDRNQHIVCAANAGIYDKQLQPLGMYIEQGRLLRRLNRRQNAYGNFYMQPNGVFMIFDGQAKIVDTETLAADLPRWQQQARYATQSGPIMLQNRVINMRFDPDSMNVATRNAVCTVSDNQVVLAIARNPITFYDFAVFLRDRLDCVDALYLDGNISRMSPSFDDDLGPAFGAIIAVVK